MARTVTLAQLRSDASLYADLPDGSTQHITSTSRNRLINLACTELYDLLVAARGHEYYASEGTLSLSQVGGSRYNLPADFYELLSVTLEWGTGNHEPVEDYASVVERANYTNWNSWAQWEPKAYRLRGAQIEFLPAPTSSVTARLQYIPTFTDLANDGSTIDCVNGWDKLVSLRVALELCAIANKQPSGMLMSLYDRERARVEELAAERNAGAPKRIIDMQPEGARRNGWPPLPRRVTV